jgi:hypothetical protein
MKTSSAKAKGRRFQQHVAKKIAEKYNLEYGVDKDVQSRGMGQQGIDIALSKTAIKVFPFSCECKNTERLNLWDSIKQAKDNKQEDTEWVLFVKANRKDPIVIMDMETFFELYTPRKSKED